MGEDREAETCLVCSRSLRLTVKRDEDGKVAPGYIIWVVEKYFEFWSKCDGKLLEGFGKKWYNLIFLLIVFEIKHTSKQMHRLWYLVKNNYKVNTYFRNQNPSQEVEDCQHLGNPLCAPSRLKVSHLFLDVITILT